MSSIAKLTRTTIQKNYRMVIPFGFSAFVLLLLVINLIIRYDWGFLSLFGVLFPLLIGLAIVAKNLVVKNGTSFNSFYFGFRNINLTNWLMIRSFTGPLFAFLLAFFGLITVGSMAVNFIIPSEELLQLINLSETASTEELITFLQNYPALYQTILIMIVVALVGAIGIALWVRLPSYFTFYASLDYRIDPFKARLISKEMIAPIRWRYFLFNIAFVIPLIGLGWLFWTGLDLFNLWWTIDNINIDFVLRSTLVAFVWAPALMVYYIANAHFYQIIKRNYDLAVAAFLQKMATKSSDSNPA